MYLNSINIPNQILDALQNNNLVIFAGAGASVDKPTSLPNFRKLAEEIAEGTGKKLGKKEACEVFLGALKARGVDVNGDAARILSSSCLRHNALHEAIVNLFESPDKVKIVTTNYDQMFEQVIDERGFSVPVFNAPALPLGDDINGIVHIHGNVNNPKYMVVTDEDFGRAYLTDGYASRFLVKLFESYTIVFIGYSYNDTILRYLTRAMTRDRSKNRYILTDDTKSDWKSLGITAINYPKRSHAVMRGSLVKLGNYAKRGLLEWSDQFVEIADAPPRDLSIDTEIDYCLESIDKTRVLSDSISGSEWINILDRKGVFDTCFSVSAPMTEKDLIWANWLCNNFVGHYDYGIKRLLCNHKNQLNSVFSELILHNVLHRDSSLSDECFKEYITLLDNHLADPWVILKFIEISNRRELHRLSLKLFEKLFDVSFIVEENNWLQENSIELKHAMLGNYHCIMHAWEIINENVVQLYASEVVSFAKNTIEELYYHYTEIGVAANPKEPWSMVVLSVEDRDNEYDENPLKILVKIYLQAIITIEMEDAKDSMLKCLKSGSTLLRRIALRAIRESSCFNNDEKMKLLLDNEMIWFYEGKEQVFLLVKEVLPLTSYERQNQLIDIIEKGCDDYNDEYVKQYEIYNWCVWLKKINFINSRIDSIVERIMCRYDFSPRKNPERNYTISGGVWSEEKSPCTSQELLEMPFDEMTELLIKFKGNQFEGPTRWGLYNTFSSCVKENVQWAIEVSKYFYNSKLKNEEVWSCLIRGLSEAELPFEEKSALLDLFASIIDELPAVIEVANYLWTLLQKNEMKDSFKEYECKLFELSEKIWNKREGKKPKSIRLADASIYTTTGIILLCWINMVSYSTEEGIPDKYKYKFEGALKLKTWEQELAFCVLAGQINFLCYRDRVWSSEFIFPALTGSNKKLYISAWEGVIIFSRRIGKDTADIMSPVFLKAAKKIKWLGGETRSGFIDLYLTLLIYSVERPTLKYIPVLYNSSSEKEWSLFIRAIGTKLRSLDLDTRLKWWDNWLRLLLENRKRNKPVELNDSECRELFMLLPRLDFVIEDAITIICRGSVPSHIDDIFWLELSEEKNILSHSHSIAKLLITLLKSISSVGYSKQYIAQIVESLRGLEQNERKQLQEVLLKHSIKVNLEEDRIHHQSG